MTKMDPDSDCELSENPLAIGGDSVVELVTLGDMPEHHDEVEMVDENVDNDEPEVMEVIAVQIAAPNDVMEGIHENVVAIHDQDVIEEIEVNDEPNEVEVDEPNDVEIDDDNGVVENNATLEGSNNDVIECDAASEDGEGVIENNTACYSDDEDIIDIDHEYNPGLIANVALEQLTDDWNKAIERRCGGKPNYFDKDHLFCWGFPYS